VRLHLNEHRIGGRRLEGRQFMVALAVRGHGILPVELAQKVHD
jgi:hypothetical protein